MKVLLVARDGMPQGSGGVIAMHRLHQELLARGVQSTVACRRGDFSRPDITPLPSPRRAEGLIAKVTWRMGLNDVHCLNTFRLTETPAFREADVVNIHGFHSGFFNYLALPKLARAKPLVATLHDMWPITGHCSYSFDCPRWETEKRCPSSVPIRTSGRGMSPASRGSSAASNSGLDRSSDPDPIRRPR